MAPRAGKSTGIAIPRVLRAPGAVLLTSNKSDVFAVTRHERDEVGRSGRSTRRASPTPRARCGGTSSPTVATIEGARRLAGHFVGSVNDDSSKKDFWISAAQNTLTALFLAAARGGAPSPTCWPGWPTRPTAPRSTCSATPAWRPWPSSSRAPYAARSRPATASTRPPGSAWPACSTRRSSPGSLPTRTSRSSARTSTSLSRDTLYLLSKDGGGSAAGVIAGLADATMRAGVVAAERMGGRLDPPMTAVLDEAANVCRISDLPDLYSHLGSRGINVVTLLQSYRQGARVWGEAGMDALWSAATIKLLGAGLDDADFVEKISRLVGQHDVSTPSSPGARTARPGRYSYRQEQVLPPDRIRALPKGTALLLATGVRPALIRLRPWYKEPNAGPISAAAKARSRPSPSARRHGIAGSRSAWWADRHGQVEAPGGTTGTTALGVQVQPVESDPVCSSGRSGRCRSRSWRRWRCSS